MKEQCLHILHSLTGTGWLIQNCQYGELLEDLLLDKIICSIKDHSLRARLWENRKIYLETAIDICRSKEASDKQLTDINIRSKSNSNGLLADVNKFQTSNRNSKQKSHSTKQESEIVSCNYCGYKHKKIITVQQKTLLVVKATRLDILHKCTCQDARNK